MNIFQRRKKTPIPTFETLDKTCLPILSGPELVELLNLSHKLRNIRMLSRLSYDYFDAYFYPALMKAIEAFQLIPASGSYHHTDSGGLIIHTLTVIECALVERQEHTLPQFASPAHQAQEQHIWTYGIFIAALLHDVGKTLTQQDLILSNGDIFDPFDQLPLSQTYTLKFKNLESSYRLHQQFSSLFFSHIIPPEGQIWLTKHLHVLDELSAFIQGNHLFGGTIAKIIQTADSKSVAESSGLYNSKRFMGAKPPLSEKIIVAIRQIVPSLGLNNPGSAVFKKDGSVWIMAKTLGDQVRTFLTNHNEPVPEDNNRIFDELEYSNFALKGTSGIVQRIHIKIPKLERVFTMVGFDCRKLYGPDSLPNDMEGELTIVNSEFTLPDIKLSPEINNSKIDNKENKDINSAREPNHAISSNEHSDNIENDINNSFNLLEEDDFQSHDISKNDEINTKSPGSPQNKSFRKWNKIDLPSLPEDGSINSAATGRVFIEWLRLMLKHRRYEINSGPVHKIHPQYLGILSPFIFIEFCKDYEIGAEMQSKVRNGVKKAGYLLTSSKRKDIFKASVSGQSYSLYFCIIEADSVLDATTKVEVNSSIHLVLPPVQLMDGVKN